MTVFGRVFAPSCASALQVFIRQYAPCQYQYQHLKMTVHCIIRKADHVTGHRMSDGTIREGKFIPPNSFDSSIWLKATLECLVTIEDNLRKATKSSPICINRTPDFVREAHASHRKILGRFFQGFATNVTSRFTCFGCLMEIPQFPLACGHFLCADCVKMFGKVSELGVASLDTCPLDANPASGFVPCSISVGSGNAPVTPSKRGTVTPRTGYVTESLSPFLEFLLISSVAVLALLDTQWGMVLASQQQNTQLLEAPHRSRSSRYSCLVPILSAWNRDAMCWMNAATRSSVGRHYPGASTDPSHEARAHSCSYQDTWPWRVSDPYVC